MEGSILIIKSFLTAFSESRFDNKFSFTSFMSKFVKSCHVLVVIDLLWKGKEKQKDKYFQPFRLMLKYFPTFTVNFCVPFTLFAMGGAYDLPSETLLP